MEATKEKHATFTPGPWMISCIDGVEDSLMVGGGDDGSDIVADIREEKDARLIAAAPAMYEVLQEILAPCPVKGYLGKYDHRRTYNARKKAREILAKVDGGEG